MENKVNICGRVRHVVAVDGRSAYELAVMAGFEGTLEEWLASIKGEPGYTPVAGVDYYTEEEKAAVVDEIQTTVTGDIHTALDGIIEIQETLIGGDT